MGSGSANNISEQLDALRERFVIKTREQLQVLSAMIRRIRAESAQPGDLSDTYQMLHRLAGSSGTFGFDALGQRARELEFAGAEVVVDEERQVGYQLAEHLRRHLPDPDEES